MVGVSADQNRKLNRFGENSFTEKLKSSPARESRGGFFPYYIIKENAVFSAALFLLFFFRCVVLVFVYKSGLLRNFNDLLYLI